MWKKGNPLTLLLECKLVQPLWKTLWRFLKKLKIELPYNPAIPLLGIYLKNNKNTNLKRYMHPNVHSSIIYNFQDMEGDVIHTYTHTDTHTLTQTQWNTTQP